MEKKLVERIPVRDMIVKIGPETPGVFQAMIDMENKRSITGMHVILRESLYTPDGKLMSPDDADKYCFPMSYSQMNEMGDKFKAAMEGLKAQALPPTGSGL